MTKKEALEVLGQACQAVKANWQEHLVLQQALKVVAEEPKEEPKEE